jgi:hypothetical protein
METTGWVHADLGRAGSLWMFAAPAADIRAMSVGGSCCIHCTIVRRRLAPPSSCRRSPGSDTRHEALLAISRLLGTPQAPPCPATSTLRSDEAAQQLLRAKPLPRHLQTPLPAHSLTRSGPKKPSQIIPQANWNSCWFIASPSSSEDGADLLWRADPRFSIAPDSVSFGGLMPRWGCQADIETPDRELLFKERPRVARELNDLCCLMRTLYRFKT